jgi:hypothetical protein
LGLAALTSHWCDFALAQNDLRRSARLCGEGLLYARECRGQWLMVFSIFRLARIAIASDDDERGVYLAAAAVAAADTIGVRPNPKLQPPLDDARTRLGDDAFSAQWAAGSALTLDQAVAEALEAIDVFASG